MTNPLRHPFFLCASGLYVILFVLKKSSVHLPFVSDYLADFLALPVVLSIALWGIRISKTDRRQWTYHWLHIAFLVLLFAFLFEFLYPRMTDRFTSDPWDVLAYALGGLVFWRWMNK